MDPVSRFFSAIEGLPETLRYAILTMQATPSNLSLLCQFAVNYDSRNKTSLATLLEEMTSIDKTASYLQLAEAYLLEGNACNNAHDYTSALALYEISSRLCSWAEDEAPPLSALLPAAKHWRAECLVNIGFIYFNTKQLTKASKFLQLATNLFASLGGQPHPRVMRIQKEIADTTTSHDQARIPDHNTSIDGLIDIADCAYKSGNVLAIAEITPFVVPIMDASPDDQRIFLVAKFLRKLAPSLADITIYKILLLYEHHPEASHYRDGRFLWLCLVRTLCYTGVVSNPAYLYLTVHLVESLSLEIKNLSERVAFRQIFHPEYTEAIRWALGKNNADALLALRLVDLLKCRTTLDLMLARKAAYAKPSPPASTEGDRFILPAERNQQEFSTADAQRGKTTLSSGGANWKTVGKFEAHLKAISQQSIVASNEDSTHYISINAARRMANSHSLIIEYALIEDILHVFATKSTRYQDNDKTVWHWIKQVGLSPDSLLDAACSRIRRSNVVSRPDAQNSAESILKESADSGRELYELVIGAVIDTWDDGQSSVSLRQLVADHHHLIIIPTGPLCSISWYSLLTERGWLWQNHLVSIMPSLSFLWMATYVPRPMKNVLNGVLLVGNPTCDLPGAEAECNHLASAMNACGIRNTLLIGKDATLAEVRRLSPSHDILHFACHGKRVIGDPANSHLILADGPLFSAELASFDLEGKTLVLSSCESGEGEISWGDDNFALAHACLIAGAAYALASAWPVSDASTQALMQGFYVNFLRGMSPQFALNTAISAIARQDQFKLAFYWAPFQLYGSADVDAQAVVRQAVHSESSGADPVLFNFDPRLDEKRALMVGL